MKHSVNEIFILNWMCIKNICNDIFAWVQHLKRKKDILFKKVSSVDQMPTKLIKCSWIIKIIKQSIKCDRLSKSRQQLIHKIKGRLEYFPLSYLRITITTHAFVHECFHFCFPLKSWLTVAPTNILSARH